MKIHNFRRLFLGHHYYTLSLSDLCLIEEKKKLKEKKDFNYMYMTFGHDLAQESLSWGLIFNFGGPLLGHHYYILSLSNLCLGVKRKIF